jgi:hypothetical protein
MALQENGREPALDRSPDRSRAADRRRLPGMALQRRLGLRTGRWARRHADHCDSTIVGRHLAQEIIMAKGRNKPRAEKKKPSKAIAALRADKAKAEAQKDQEKDG